MTHALHLIQGFPRKTLWWFCGGLSLLMLISIFKPALVWADGTLVVITADWCASCRDVMPVVTQVAGESSKQVTSINVDSNNAPNQATQYGINLTGSELPQIYLFQNGHSQLLLSGKQHQYGKSQETLSILRSKLGL